MWSSGPERPSPEARHFCTAGSPTEPVCCPQAHLLLANFQYERRYYEKEIRDCEDFQHAHTDEQIGLVPLEEFWEAAPPELTADLDRNKPDEHLFMLRVSGGVFWRAWTSGSAGMEQASRIRGLVGLLARFLDASRARSGWSLSECSARSCWSS